MHASFRARFLRPVLRVAVVAAVVAAVSTGIGAVPRVHAAGAPGAIYTLTNQSSGNQVAIFNRAADGSLTAAGTVLTGGNGTGAGLGSQGALVLSDDHRWLFAVNAGSNSIAVLAVTPTGLTLSDTASSGGSLPISLTVHDDLLYVLNAGGSGSISGFRVHDGHLTPLAGSTQPLSSSAAGPAQVQFRPDGRVLLVTEKNTNTIDTYVVDAHGVAGPPTAHPSSGPTPFGFAFTKHDLAIVSEAANSTVSSYTVATSGALQTASASVPDFQAAPCWVVITENGKYAYTANAHNGTLSGFDIGHDGQLRLLTPGGVTASTGATSAPTDTALSANSQFLYVLTNGTHSISAFGLAADGSLRPLAGATGLAGGFVGLAAR